MLRTCKCSSAGRLLGEACRGCRRDYCRPALAFVAAYYAAPLLITNGHGLIVNTGYYGAVSYHYGPAYGAQKAGADKMAADMAKELRPSTSQQFLSGWGLLIQNARVLILQSAGGRKTKAAKRITTVYRQGDRRPLWLRRKDEAFGARFDRRGIRSQTRRYRYRRECSSILSL